MDSGIPYYGRAVQSLRAHICQALNIHERTVRIVTYPKGRRNWANTPPRWQGIVNWHYAPRTPVRPPGTNTYIPARGLRLRWGNEIIMERSWCIPGTEPPQPGPAQPSGSGLAARAETTSGTPEATRTFAEWETGTAVPTDFIEIDGDFVCEMPQKPTSTRTTTATTEASTGSEDATSGATGTIRETGTITEATGMLETSSILETSSFLETSSVPESTDATSSEVDHITSTSSTSISQTTIWFSTRNWDEIIPTTTDSSTSPTSISRTTIWFSTRNWDEITHTHFDTISPSTSTTAEAQIPSPTTAQPAPENTDTVKYHFTQLLISPHNIESNPTYVEIQAFQRGRSMFEDEDDNDIEAGTWSFDDPNGWDGKKITRELENYGTQTRVIPGTFSISLELVPLESKDDPKPRNFQVKYLWLNQEWDTTPCDFKLNTGNPTSGFEYSRRTCTFDVRLWGKNGLCTLHPDHKDCEGISE
ncbi:hypothetical protein F5X68DRAFT_198619 [Plectosphaerella plurivora]|uniref:Uncharacterized protein n=1 Tax=Plectosphaerella plurivora TaxID=936078 RepID=A0A9P9AHL5_9PEZI|nr:hypothetical protein F5X68DRAFT_198619 [Plectosphaerella plurivora]